MPAKDLPIHPEQLPRLVSREGISVREDTLYTNHKGVEKARLRKDVDKTLTRLKDVLAKVLEPQEAVLYLAPVQAPLSAVQQLTLGWMTYALSRSMLVVTNRRLLDFHLKAKSFGRWEWGRAVRSIRFGDIAEAKTRPGLFSGTLTLRYADGGKEKYWKLRRADARKIRLLLENLLPGSVGENTPARAPVSLCPNCFAALAPKLERCAQCQLVFATERELVRRSILFPGGGYFYVGQTALGLLDAWVESFFIFLLVSWLLVVAGFPSPFLRPLDPYPTPGGALVVVGFVAGVLAFEKLVTIFHGRHFVRSFYPLDKPPSQMRWTVLGVAAYTLIILAAWVLIPEEKPLMTVAPDVVVYSAEFGIFNAQPDGQIAFTPTATVPRNPGQYYGFVLRLRTPRPAVKLGLQFEFEAAPGVVQPVHEESADATGGVITYHWQVEPNEPEGRQTLKVSLEGMSVRNFTFTVR